MGQPNSDLVTYAECVRMNVEQLEVRVVPDEYLIRRHWASERVLAAFIPAGARTILDLGCGPTGGFLYHIPEMVYIGLDFVHDYLAKLRRGHSPQGNWPFARRHWAESGMERLPFATGTFDVVYSRHSLEHSSDLRSALSEIRRVLRPGGMFIFCVPARLDDTEPTHLTRWPGRQWLAAFRRVGRVGFYAHHDYFIDEFYGCVVTPGGARPPLTERLRRLSDFNYGQGRLPLFVVRIFVWLFARWRQLGGDRGRSG